MKSRYAIERYKNNTLPSVWSVDRIARLIIGLVNIVLLLATYCFSRYFILGLCLVNLNLIFSSLTDICPFKMFLKKMGAKEREDLLFNNSKVFQSCEPPADSDKILLAVKQKI